MYDSWSTPTQQPRKRPRGLVLLESGIDLQGSAPAAAQLDPWSTHTLGNNDAVFIRSTKTGYVRFVWYARVQQSYL